MSRRLGGLRLAGIRRDSPRAIGWTGGLFASALTCLSPMGVEAQLFEGRVLSDPDEVPVATALVRLLDADGEPIAISIADSVGGFRIAAPAPGVYRLDAERLGFRKVQSPLLEVVSEDATYAVDLLMVAAPVELPGLRVETERLSDEEADRGIQLILGSSVHALRYRPIRYAEIQDHLARGHSLEDLLRWSDTVGLIVRYTSEGPCFSLRGRGCLDVYLNDLRLNRDFMGDIPLDLIHTIVVVTPTDPVMTGSAVRLYTESWIR
jgi:carboxypeptidase family protein